MSDSAPSATESGTRRHLDALALRDWQADALATWSRTGRGVVEAVTGTGKTRLAMAALRMIVDRGGRALVLVPTIDLQEQWVRELRTYLGDRRVGRLGGGHDADLFDVEVLVATPHSAASVPLDLPTGVPGLLVADEAHRYGAPTWASALAETFMFRLALTATYERGDDGLVDVLDPYFGGVIYRYGFDRAVADGTVAPFDVALVGVALSDAEREAYDTHDARCRRLHRQLTGPFGMPREPDRLFAAVTAIVSRANVDGADGPQTVACREYLSQVRLRRTVAALAEAKVALCRQLAPGLDGRRSIVFTDSVEQAEAAARMLAGAGLAAETVHGELSRDRRRIRLAQFRKGALDVVVAPRVLDEGVDVPDADVAVVLAAFRTRRQMVQRLGRVLRLKASGHGARMVVVYAAGTAEDPQHGGHRAFLDEIAGVARSRVDHDVAHAPEQLAAWIASTS